MLRVSLGGGIIEVNYSIKANGKSVNGEIPEGTPMADLLGANVDEVQAKIDGTLVVAVQIVKYLKVDVVKGQDLVATAMSGLADYSAPFDCSMNIALCVEGKVDVDAMDDAEFKALAVDPEVRLESREFPSEQIAVTPIVIPPKKLG